MNELHSKMASGKMEPRALGNVPSYSAAALRKWSRQGRYENRARGFGKMEPEALGSHGVSENVARGAAKMEPGDLGN